MAENLLIETETETDGRWIAEIRAIPGVMVYGATREEAVVRAKVLALRVLAERIESGEEIPETSGLFAVTPLAGHQGQTGTGGIAPDRMDDQAAGWRLAPRARARRVGRSGVRVPRRRRDRTSDVVTAFSDDRTSPRRFLGQILDTCRPNSCR
jgi:predicted RNase H-like HicB family nuclease